LAVFLPSPAGGGVERVFADLVTFWRDEGREVTVIVANGRGPLREIFADGTRFIDLGVKHVTAAIPALTRVLRAAPEMPLLSSMSHSNIAALLATRFLTKHRGRVVVQEASRLTTGREGGRLWKHRMVPWLLKPIYARADAVIAVSEGVAAELATVLGWPRERIRVIPNPLPLARIAEAAAAPCQHPWLAPGSQSPIILGIGRLSPEKDFSTLLRAFAMLGPALDARLVLLGSGPQEGVLRSLARQLSLDNVVDFCGFVPNPWALMSRSALVVSSSIAEGFSLVLAEAMACGTNVVSVDSGPAVRALMPESIFGSFCQPGDSGALAAAMAERLANPLPRLVLQSLAQRFEIRLVAPCYTSMLLPQRHANEQRLNCPTPL
jgi:glycosyltransferase involved in cell wall biosynthesis